jgi:hypothetical protein
VLQNDKYMEFAADGAVDVIAEQDLDKAVDKKDRRVETYDAKDENGKPVKYMKEWPNMTFEEMVACYKSPAPAYNDTKGIPYVAIVDPYTLKKMRGFNDTSSKSLIEEIKAATATLQKEHGPSVKRSTLSKVKAGVKDVEAVLAKGGPAKAMPDLRKLEGQVAKEPDAVKNLVKEAETKVLEAAKVQLDDAEAKLAAGDVKAASAILNPLASPLKGTELAARVKELQDKAKAAAAPPAK